MLRKKQRAAKSADAPAAARKAAAGKAASAAPPGPDGLGVTVASPAGDQGGPPVKRRRARRPVRKQRGKIGCMVHGAYIETEIYDSDESEGGYDVLMQRRAIRRVCPASSCSICPLRCICAAVGRVHVFRIVRATCTRTCTTMSFGALGHACGCWRVSVAGLVVRVHCILCMHVYARVRCGQTVSILPDYAPAVAVFSMAT